MQQSLWTKTSKAIGFGEYGRPVQPDEFPTWEEITQAGHDAMMGDVSGLRRLLIWNRFLESPRTPEERNVMAHLEKRLILARAKYQGIEA